MSTTIYTPLAAPLLDATSQAVRIPRLTYTGVFMSERKVTATITSPTTLALVSGCYITFRNETFRLYDTPSAKKVASASTSQSAFEYTLVFYSSQHELATTDFIDIVSDDSHTYFNGGPVVEFTGTIEMMAERIQANMDRIYTGANSWTVTIDPSVTGLDSADISLTDSTVWDALMLVSTTPAWALKFRIVGRTITIGVSVTVQDDVTFKYGKGKGLYEITRTNVDSSKIITRLRAYGAATNIPADYKRSGSGYVAPTYQYIKELAIPNYCYVVGTTVNATGKGNWSVSVQYAIGDLVRYTDGKRYYCKSIPAIGIVPTNVTYWTLWNEGYIEDPAAIAEFGVREGILRDETIFPTLKGMLGTGGVELDSILAVEPITDEAQTSFRVWIRDIGFNIKDYLNTEKPTLSITRGALTGYDFEITNVATSVVTFPSGGTSAYAITLTRNSEDNFIVPSINNNIYQSQETVSGTVYLLPNSSTESDKAKYVLTGISMPNVYVRAAEERLLIVAQAYLDKYSVQQVTYAVGIDEIAAATNTVTWVSSGLIEGDLMPVLDVDMGVYGATVSDAKLIVVQTLTIAVGDGMVNKYEVVLSDEPVAGTLDAIKSQIKETGKTVVLGERASDASARKNAVSLNNLKDVIFDTDGYFDGTHIKPNSIETLYLSVGAKSWDFMLYADIKPNAVVSGHTPNFDNIYLSAGTLVHHEIRWGADTDEGHAWTIETELVTTGLARNSIFYIYVKCYSDGTAEWIVDNYSHTVNSEANCYYFLVGVLYESLLSGETIPHERGDSITYGKTWINGRFITTGIIKSLGGKSFFDLDNGHFYIGDNANIASATKYLDMNVDGTFRMKNITIVSGSGSSILGAFMGAYSAATPYYEGDTVTYQGGLWRYIYASSTSGHAPTNTTYWAVQASKGTDGTSVSIKGACGTTTDLPLPYQPESEYMLGMLVLHEGHHYYCYSLTYGHLPTDTSYWNDLGLFAIGDGYITEDNGHLWIWSGTTWSDAGQIKGDTGVGISSVAAFYLVSSSATGITVLGNTWYSGAPSMTPTTKYLWSYQTITYTDASSQNSTPAIIGVYGDKGLTGDTGAAGGSLYTWIKYADTAIGGGLSDSPDGKLYIGLAYNKTTGTESTTASDYAWSLIKGDTGNTGVKGDTGDNGLTYYTWIKYADVADGTGLYDTPTSATLYIGIAVNKLSPIESTTKTDYTWSKFRGDAGVQGATGNYYEHRYAVNGSPTVAPSIVLTDPEPTGWTTVPPALAILQYMWITTARKTAAGVVMSPYWSTPQRLSGAVGNVGPASTYNGVWNADTAYSGSEFAVQAVYYESSYFITRSDAGIIAPNTLPTDTSKWNPYGASFESIATGMLLAQGANVAGFIFMNGKLVSQTGTISGVASTDYSNPAFIPNITLDGTSGYGKFGLLELVGGNVISDHFKITDDDIESIATAIADHTYTIPFKTEQQNLSVGLTEDVMESDEIAIEANSTISAFLRNYSAFSLPSVYTDNTYSTVSCNLAYKLELINNGVVIATNTSGWYAVGGLYTRAYTDGAALSAIPIFKGSVKFRSTIYMDNPLGWDPEDYLIVHPLITASSVGAATNVTCTATIHRAMIGADGLFSFTGTDRYMYWRGKDDANDIFKVRIGNVILSQTATTISMSGLPTSSSGLASGSLWRNGAVINIVP